jgi:group I intron endonuclease
MKGIICIYKIVSRENGKIYIGSTNNYVERKGAHLNQLKKSKHNNKFLQRHYDKYGKFVFEFYIVENVANESLLLEREQFYIDLLNPEFNNSRIAGKIDYWKGKKRSDADKEKMRLAKIGKKKGPMSEETKMKISKANKGRVHSEAIKKNMTNKFEKGLIPWNKGLKMSETAKQKMIATKKGRPANLNGVKAMQLANIERRKNKSEKAA